MKVPDDEGVVRFSLERFGGLFVRLQGQTGRSPVRGWGVGIRAAAQPIDDTKTGSFLPAAQLLMSLQIYSLFCSWLASAELLPWRVTNYVLKEEADKHRHQVQDPILSAPPIHPTPNSPEASSLELSQGRCFVHSGEKTKGDLLIGDNQCRPISTFCCISIAIVLLLWIA